ncbi:fimbria/pilus periplasmic chaperone [Shigella flexneri]
MFDLTVWTIHQQVQTKKVRMQSKFAMQNRIKLFYRPAGTSLR